MAGIEGGPSAPIPLWQCFLIALASGLLEGVREGRISELLHALFPIF